MTAVTNRSFDGAFSGVYGGSPAELYGRFSAEVTANALALERALRQDGLVEGTLVQRLIHDTGDPAISSDGRHLALTIRRVDAPSELVVWNTADAPDTAAAARRAAQIKRDPQDVPDRAFYPLPKKPVITLVAGDGAPYEMPRWFADDMHLLVARLTPMPDGTLRSDLYVWSAVDGALRRVTRGAGVREADPSADGRWAAAVRCDHGWCDLVRVDLRTGAVRVLRAGSVTHNYYRPRVSRVTGEIVVAEQFHDRWRIARVSSETGALTYADPDDGVTRYDAAFEPDGRTIVATSEAGGIANLERLDSAGTSATRLTSTTGAAVAADVASDGAIWFLALQGKGYDLRRLPADSIRVVPAASVATALVDSLSPVMPPRIMRVADDSSARPALAAAPRERAYGFGPSRLRYLPAGTTGFGGSTSQLAVVRSDPVGRLGIAVMGSAGSASLPEGGAVTVTSRATRTVLTANGWMSHEAPSRELDAALAAGLDLSRAGGALRAERMHAGDGFELTGTAALLVEHQRATGLAAATRSAGIVGGGATFRQRDDETRYEEVLAVLGEAGRTSGGAYLRQRSAADFGVASRARPLTTLSLSFGNLGGGGGTEREQFAIGGFASPLVDSLYDARRVDAPAYPLASATGLGFTAFRVTVPVAPVALFYSGASADFFRHPLRSYGAEIRERVPSIAALGTPAVDVLTGVARAVDEPVKGAWRYYVSLAVRP
jgi:hypothetical protein